MEPGIDYIGVGVGVMVLDEQGRVFLAQRGPEARNERGRWDLPGGGVEFGDDLEATAAREMQEEHGVVVEILELLCMCNHIIRAASQHWVAPTYLGRIVSGTPRIIEPEKCSAIGWFTLAETRALPLTITAAHNLRVLSEKRPELV